MENGKYISEQTAVNVQLISNQKRVQSAEKYF